MRPNERYGMRREEHYLREIMAFASVFMSGKYLKYSFYCSLEAELGNR